MLATLPRMNELSRPWLQRDVPGFTRAALPTLVDPRFEVISQNGPIQAAESHNCCCRYWPVDLRCQSGALSLLASPVSVLSCSYLSQRERGGGWRRPGGPASRLRGCQPRLRTPDGTEG